MTSYQGVWTDNPLWSYLVRYDGGPLWSTSWLAQRLLDPPNPSSQQCVDCVVDAGTGLIAIQYKSFPPYQKLSDSTGNGGDLLCITDANEIYIFATADGGHPGQLYYFVGPAGPGWLIAGSDLNSAWSGRVVQLAQAYPGPSNQEGSLSPAYTRYLRAMAAIPGNGQRTVIVSEHYGTADPTQAPEMERFVYGRWMGLIRWEYYALPSVPAVPGVLERAGGDFPFGYPSSIPLNPALVLRDCRSWINWTPSSNPEFTVQGAGWPVGAVLP